MKLDLRWQRFSLVVIYINHLLCTSFKKLLTRHFSFFRVLLLIHQTFWRSGKLDCRFPYYSWTCFIINQSLKAIPRRWRLIQLWLYMYFKNSRLCTTSLSKIVSLQSCLKLRFPLTSHFGGPAEHVSCFLGLFFCWVSLIICLFCFCKNLFSCADFHKV